MEIQVPRRYKVPTFVYCNICTHYWPVDALQVPSSTHGGVSIQNMQCHYIRYVTGGMVSGSLRTRVCEECSLLYKSNHLGIFVIGFSSCFQIHSFQKGNMSRHLGETGRLLLVCLLRSLLFLPGWGSSQSPCYLLVQTAAVSLWARDWQSTLSAVEHPPGFDHSEHWQLEQSPSKPYLCSCVNSGL